MTNVIVAFPKPEDAKSIRNILVKNGFPVVAVCTSGAQTLQYADDLHNGVVVCGYRLTDMIYSQLREDLSEQFDMLLSVSLNSSYVSPGKPTIISLVIESSSPISFLAYLISSRYCSLV